MSEAGTPARVLLLTPPFCQLNTPYPATLFLKGFLHLHNIPSFQADLGIEVIDRLFSPAGFGMLFREIESGHLSAKGSLRKMLNRKEEYIQTIGPVMQFLRGHQPELAHRICSRDWLPEGRRFAQIPDLQPEFGRLGLQDKGKYLATCYLEDISDLITGTVDPRFGFSRYAEHLGRYAYRFDELEQALEEPSSPSLVDRLTTEILEQLVEQHQPQLIAFTIPFPGNLFGALRCGQWVRRNHPAVKIVLGGGFVSTELRSLSDPRIFRYTDFICLDDGEVPLLNILDHLDRKRPVEMLKRTYCLKDGLVCLMNGSEMPDPPVSGKGTPDYGGLPMEKYLSVLEMANPMHRLWSDGRWNKLMLAHGCYWGKCSFCDVTLDYIRRYEPNTATSLCDQMEAIIRQTGRTGFHFTDEAAPPALLRSLAEEILRRKLTITWWTNIRFEKNFTPELCQLLKKSGCIAVSGGLEVASPRILKMINKGVTVEQVTQVTANFSRSGILVHAYLMYGFPTQTARETIDSLEIVRQLFKHGLVQSGFWHRFALTAHSPVGQNPERFGIGQVIIPEASFALNDLDFTDPAGCDHERFGEGLRKALYNYMHGQCFHFQLREWFDFPVPETSVSPRFVKQVLSEGKAKNK